MFVITKIYLYLHRGKSHTTSSCLIPQGGNAARVDGRSGVMWVACHFFYAYFL